MLDFFDWVISSFENLFTLLFNLIDSLVSFLVIVPQVAAFPLQLLSYVPGLLGTCILCVVSVGIIKLCLGWGNS